MKFNKIVNAGQIVREIMNAYIKDGDTLVDATVGNGHDTAMMAHLCGHRGKVYGFDIQSAAIENTADLLKEKGILNRVQLINDGHENMDEHISEKVDFIVYNLGYLPGGNKNIKTTSSTTIISINKALNMLNNHGIIVITAYPGHEGGEEEKSKIEDVLRALNQKEYNILKYDFINQRNHPPVVYCVEFVN